MYIRKCVPFPNRTDFCALIYCTYTFVLGVVCVMGNHYSGQYDPVKDVSDALESFNKEHGFQIGIHVDAASGGFVAPFQKEVCECTNVFAYQ